MAHEFPFEVSLLRARRRQIVALTADFVPPTLTKQLVETVTDQFAYPSSYEGQPLYETLSQQALKTAEQTPTGTWNFSDNLVAGHGAPWPGEGITQRAYPADKVESLQKPSTKPVPSQLPKSIEHGAAITIKYV